MTEVNRFLSQRLRWKNFKALTYVRLVWYTSDPQWNANRIDVARALYWVKFHSTYEGDDHQDGPIAASVRRTDDRITIRWSIDGDPEEAREIMQQVLSGTWPGWEVLL